jgi:hypothetical protein
MTSPAKKPELVIMYKLPETLRATLKAPLGELISEEELTAKLKRAKKIVAVGDICAYTLYRHAIEPDITIVDYKSHRGVLKDTKLRQALMKLGDCVIRTKNPAGCITTNLWQAIATAYVHITDTNVKVRVEVDGEEDLATLPSIILAGLDTAIVYGQPDEGLVVVWATDERKRYINELLQRFNH